MTADPAALDGKTVPVSYGGIGSPVIGEATLHVDEHGVTAVMTLGEEAAVVTLPGTMSFRIPPQDDEEPG